MGELWSPLVGHLPGCYGKYFVNRLVLSMSKALSVEFKGEMARALPPFLAAHKICGSRDGP